MLNLHDFQIKIKKSYLWSMLLLIALLSFSFLTLSQFIFYQKADAKLINIAGKQRMLSQKIVLHLRYYQQGSNQHKVESERRTIIQLAQNMYQDHLTLLNNTDDLSASVRYLYFVPSGLLHERIKQFTDNAITATQINNSVQLFTFIDEHFSIETTDKLLNDVSFIVDQMAEHSINHLNHIEKGLVVLWVIVVFSFLFFTFFAYRRISNIVKQGYKKLNKEINKATDFEFAMNQHSIVYRLTLDNKIKHVNDRFCSFFGLDKKAILGRDYNSLGINDHNLNSLVGDNFTSIGKGKTWKHEFVYNIKGFKQWLDTTIVPIKHKGKVINYMVIQDEITDQRMMNVALKEAHEGVSNNESLSDKINTLLTIGQYFFQVQNAIIGEILGNTYTVKYAITSNDSFSVNNQFELENTYCIHTLKSDSPVAFHHSKHSEMKTAPCYLDLGVNSYIGCAIYVDGKRYGALSFNSSKSRTMPFTKNQLDFIELMAQWIGVEISKAQQKEKMHSQQCLMEQMSKQARIGAWEFDLITNQITWSSMTKQIHEVEPNYQPNLNTAIDFYKEGQSRETIQAIIDKGIRDGKPFQAEVELVTAKGNTVWVSSCGQAVFEQGQCVKLYGSFQDVTEKRNVELALADKNRRMKLATDSSAIGIWEYNIITEELVWDEWMFRLYGVKKKDFTQEGKMLTEYIHPHDVERITNELQLAISDKKKFNTLFRIVTPNGDELSIKASAIVLRNLNGIPQKMIGVNYDVTDSVKNEQELIEAKNVAEEASKVKNEFLASMSHEIRTPMNGVLGMLNLVADSPLTQEQQQQVLIAKNSANFLLALINDILDFSKIDANKLQLEYISFDIRLLIEELAMSMAQQAKEKNIALIIDTVDINESIIIGDPNRIRQILTNLIGNAIKFTSKGEVVVKARLVPTDNTWRLLLLVKDTGIGISENKHSHIFENFRQVDSSTTRNFGGTGLGLAIVKRLCECMNGNVTLESVEHQGSLFSCDIEVGKAEQTEFKLLPDYFKDLSVLVVDNNLTSQGVIKAQLELWGVNTTCVSHAEEAMTLCENIDVNKDEPNAIKPFELILIDMNLVHIDGIELAVRLRDDKRFDNIQLSMMTSVNIQEDKKCIQELDILTCFAKPISNSALYNMLCAMDESCVNYGNTESLMTKHYITSLNALEDPLIKKDNFSWPDKTRILLVEDNRVNQMVAKGILAKMSLTCDIAVMGLEALATLNESTETYSLILMDCQMPEMDGYQTTQKIRSGDAGKHNRAIPIIAMTANAMDGDRDKCLNAGMNDYLSKPIDTNELLDKLTYWIN